MPECSADYLLLLCFSDVAVLNQVLVRAGRDDQAMLTTLAGLIVVLYWIIGYISELFGTIQTLFRFYGRCGLEEIIRITAVGIIGTMLAVTLKEQKKEYALLVGIATGILILYMLMDSILKIRNLFEKAVNEAGLNSVYMVILIKVIVIAYICEFAVRFSEDAGEKAFGAKIELAGRILILAVSLPIIENLFNMILNLSF